MEVPDLNEVTTMMAFMVPFWWLLIASILGFTFGFFLMAMLAMAGGRERDAEAREQEVERERKQMQLRAARVGRTRYELSTPQFAKHAYATRGR